MRTSRSEREIRVLTEQLTLTELRYQAQTSQRLRLGDRWLRRHELRAFLQLNRNQPTRWVPVAATRDEPATFSDAVRRLPLDGAPGQTTTLDMAVVRWTRPGRDEYAFLPRTSDEHGDTLATDLPVCAVLVERAARGDEPGARWWFAMRAVQPEPIGVVTRAVAERALAGRVASGEGIAVLLRDGAGRCTVASALVPDPLAEIAPGVRLCSRADVRVRYVRLSAELYGLAAFDGILRFGG